MVVLYSFCVVFLVVLFYAEDTVKEDKDKDTKDMMDEELQWNTRKRVVLKGVFRQHNEAFHKHGPKGNA